MGRGPRLPERRPRSSVQPPVKGSSLTWSSWQGGDRDTRYTGEKGRRGSSAGFKPDTGHQHTSPSSSSTSRKSKSRKTRNCCSLAVSSSVSSLVPPSSEDTPLSLTSIKSKSPHDEKMTCSGEQTVPYRRIPKKGKESPTREQRWLTEGFLVSPTSWPHRDKTLTSFSLVLF